MEITMLIVSKVAEPRRAGRKEDDGLDDEEEVNIIIIIIIIIILVIIIMGQMQQCQGKPNCLDRPSPDPNASLLGEGICCVLERQGRGG